MGIVAGSLHDSLSPCPPPSTHSFMEFPPLTVNWTYSFLKCGLQEKQWGVTSDIIKRPRLLSWAFPCSPLGGWPWGRHPWGEAHRSKRGSGSSKERQTTYRSGQRFFSPVKPGVTAAEPAA